MEDESSKVNLPKAVQKLPVGQSLITVTDAGKDVMQVSFEIVGVVIFIHIQVKLTPTLASQYWSLVNVGQGQSSIQWPDSSLVLKCSILQQAATLANTTSTIVRIPITDVEQDRSFGVYGVPGLETHVFVGPFKSKEDQEGITLEDDDKDIICLDDEIAKNYSEEVKTLMKAEEAEMKEQMKLVRKSELLGQMPHVVAKDRKSEEFDDSDIEIIEEIVPVGKANAAKAMKSELVMFAKDFPLSYASNGSQSLDHGKTDIQAVEKSNTSCNPGDTWMSNAIVADSSWGMMVTDAESDA